MSYAYLQGAGADSTTSRSLYGNSVIDAGWRTRLRDALPPEAKRWIADWRTSPSFLSRRGIRSKGDVRQVAWLMLKRIFTIPNGLILLWVLALWWGERMVFRDSIEQCAWEGWERWPQGAAPHRVAFVADPQLVDPHTYPGRPWPLSTLTVKYTDQYIRRSFSALQNALVPDSVLLLGDLFDGGREWATRTSSSPEKRYAGYKDKYWKKEFIRFARIFSTGWDKVRSSTSARGRKMITSLPGNHDLGFGTGIQDPVRARFESYFGKGNRVDIIGNHTFVSVDTVSLSAMDQPDPHTGSTGTSTDGEQPNEWIWKESKDFLDNLNTYKYNAEVEELRALNNQSEGTLFRNNVVDVSESTVAHRSQPAIVGLPTVLLTHVPLYREPATPCGPHREHHPPSSSDQELDRDEQNSIKIGAGYQYQNVLTQAISNEVISKVGPNVVQVYSGDDHDYCEILHREFNGSPREITVKSISWAMGVRRPGFMLTSLWNPIDPTTGSALETAFPTMQNHLCLLPDQLSIYIQYGYLAFLSVAVLLVRSIVHVLRNTDSTVSGGRPILPISERPSSGMPASFKKPSSGTSSSTISSPQGLIGRTANSTCRLNKLQYESYTDSSYDNPDHSKCGRRRSDVYSRPAAKLIIAAFVQDVKHVALFVLTWYFMLIWRW